MTHEEKINYMKIAAGIVGYGFDTKGLDMLISLYELVIEKQGETDLKTVCNVEADVKKRADIKSRSELLDKVSECCLRLAANTPIDATQLYFLNCQNL